MDLAVHLDGEQHSGRPESGRFGHGGVGGRVGGCGGVWVWCDDGRGVMMGVVVVGMADQSASGSPNMLRAVSLLKQLASGRI